MKKRISLSDFSGEYPRSYRKLSLPHIAGCCLIDALEFLRTDPRWPSRFSSLTIAHAVRLTWTCLGDLKNRKVDACFKERIGLAGALLLDNSNEMIPHFGYDFWDWAYILEAITTTRDELKSERARDLDYDLRQFYREVRQRLDLPQGLSLSLGTSKEWYGPATYSAAYRLIEQETASLQSETDFHEVLGKLKERSLRLVADQKLAGMKTYPHFLEWHYGQVVAQFPRDAGAQNDLIKVSASLTDLEEEQQVYALARILQGSAAMGDARNFNEALIHLNKCRNLDRPFGTGVFGDDVKASLNVLEGIWANIKEQERGIINAMLDEYLSTIKRANQIGVLVAIDTEYEAFIQKYTSEGAKIARQKNGLVKIETREYSIVLAKAKALLGAVDATRDLVQENVGAIILVGVAGSLAKIEAAADGKETIHGPKKGDVVVGAAFVAHDIRKKLRDNALNVPVPFKEFEFSILPSDPFLFISGCAAAREKGDFEVHFGTIVTKNGIVDIEEGKLEVLKDFPAGLAVAEEGFPMALYAFFCKVPCLEIRGISDYAQGDKQEQKTDKKMEKREQRTAAKNAASLVYKMLEKISKDLFTFDP